MARNSGCPGRKKGIIEGALQGYDGKVDSHGKIGGAVIQPGVSGKLGLFICYDVA